MQLTQANPLWGYFFSAPSSNTSPQKYQPSDTSYELDETDLDKIDFNETIEAKWKIVEANSTNPGLTNYGNLGSTIPIIARTFNEALNKLNQTVPDEDPLPFDPKERKRNPDITNDHNPDPLISTYNATPISIEASCSNYALELIQSVFSRALRRSGFF